jgi:hypothetical protein
MLKKSFAIITTLALFAGLASNAQAAFGNLSLIRIISDSTAGSTTEVATDLGTITDLIGANNLTVGGGGDAFTLYTDPTHKLSVNYYAWQTAPVTRGTLYIASNNTTAPSAAGSTTTKGKLNIIQTFYNGLSNANGGAATVVASNTEIGSFGQQMGMTALGGYGNYTAGFSINTNLPLVSLATAPIPMTMWLFADNTNMNSAVTGTEKLKLITNADGSTTINPTTYTVTTIVGVNGSLDASTSSPVIVLSDATPSFIFNASEGYYVASITGCNGTDFTNSDPTVASQLFITGPVTADCTVTASFATATAVKTDQTITFDAAPNLTYGGSTGTVSATATSQLPVTVFGSLTPAVCTIAGNTVTPVNAGSCTITADQSGDGSFNPAPQATLTFTINKATPPLIWATPTAITYGTALSSAQLNAGSNIPGTFVYTPAAGAVPGNGIQSLRVDFTPDNTNSANYSTAWTTVNLAVDPTVRITGNANGFDTLFAIEQAKAIVQDAIIELRDKYVTTAPETLLFNNGFAVTLLGGMDANWAPTAGGRTTIQGTVAIRSGKLVVNGLAIKP